MLLGDSWQNLRPVGEAAAKNWWGKFMHKMSYPWTINAFTALTQQLLTYSSVLLCLVLKIHLHEAHESPGCHCSSLRAHIKVCGAISQTNSSSTLLEEAETLEPFPAVAEG